MRKKEKIKISAIVLVFCLFFILLNVTLYFSLIEKSNLFSQSQDHVVASFIKTEPIKDKAVLEIDKKKYEIELVSSVSVYDFMKMFKTMGDITFTEKDYTGIGKFVDSVNGVKGNGEKNWIYYVNDKKAEIGVSNYKIKPGDVVSWKYEKNY